MKTIIQTIDLIELVNKIQNVVSQKPAISAVANILLEVFDDQLTISATDLTISMKCSTIAKVLEPGSIAIPAKRFFQLVRELIAPQVSINTTSSEFIVEISSGSSKFKINGFNPNILPKLPDIDNSTKIEVDSTILKDMFSKTIFAAGKDDKNYTLNTILLQIINNKLLFSATNGKRLSRSYTSIEIDPSFQANYMIPLRAADEIIKMLNNPKQKAIIHLSSNKIFVEHEKTIFITNLLSGQYPNIEKFLVRYPDVKVLSIHREEFISLLRQICVITIDPSKPVLFLFKNGELQIQSVTLGLGEGDISMPLDYFGEPLTIAFNPFYFEEALRHIKDEKVSFLLKGPFTPGIITDSSDSTFVIMPMRMEKVPQAANESLKEATVF